MANVNSGFPSRVLPEREFADVTDSIAVYVNKVKTLQANLQYKEAADYLAELKTQGVDLSKYIIDSSFINGMEKEIINLEQYCMSRKQSIFYSVTEPPIVNLQDVWVGGAPGLTEEEYYIAALQDVSNEKF